MPAPKLDFTINLGHIISIGTVIVAMAGGYMSFNYRLEAVEKAVDRSTAAFTTVVEQGGDIRALTQRVDRLEALLDRRFPASP